MKFPWTKISLLLLALPTFAVSNSTVETNTLFFHTVSALNAADEMVLQTRLKAINLPVSVRLTPTVHEYVREFTTYGKKGSEHMLGRTVQYFPLFEHYLELYGLPKQLKYLAMVESSLRLDAKSDAGAAGLWQMMPATAQQYGLQVNSYVDERMDMQRATEAAVRMLSELYKQFGAWELVLAAYNCGPGNVQKAIRNGGSKDFWKIRELLPSQTQVYLPRFIAAAYLAEYYEDHNLSPVYPEYDQRVTRSIKVYSQLPLTKVASIAGVSISLIRKLNPAFSQGIVPASTKGYFLVLPTMGMLAFQDYLQRTPNQSIKTDMTSAQLREVIPAKNTVTYLVGAGDSLQSIAGQHGCSKSDIIQWNQLQSENLYFRQELVIFIGSSNSTARKA